MVREEIEMVDMAVVEGVGPPLPPPVGSTPAFEPGQLLRTVDLSAVEDAPEAPPQPQARRRAVVNVGGRQVRTLQRRKSRGPKIAAQVNQTLNVQTPISLKEFSQIVGVSVPEMLRRLIQETGQITWNMNSLLDEEKVKSLSAHFKRDVVVNQEKSAEDLLDEHTLEEEMEAGGEQMLRPPVVTILGHVDHGKTSLLDKIRNSNVAAGEHGGITQHIGAFQVATESGQAITFLDTPGHAAFTAMRARGANAADIVVLVVDATDGVMPQTEEAIQHAQAAGCPIVVAMNKIDKPTSNPTRVMQQLSAHGLTAEEWGGETLMCKVSALRGDGIPELLESILLVAETMEPPLRANPESPPKGRVIEARKDPFKGVIATLIVEEGTLRRGDTVVAGMAMGRVRTMQDDRGAQVKEAPPSTPVEVFGLDDVPEAGDPFFTVADERVGREAVEERRLKFRSATVVNREMPSLENLFKMAAAGNQEMPADGKKQPPTGPKELPVILKCDVRGSLEPIKNELEKLKHPEVNLKLLYAGLGAVTKSDVDNAVAGGAIVLGFHVLTEPAARKEAERTGVEVRHYMVIYEMIDEIRAALEKKLAPEKREQTTGHAEVRAVFASSKVGAIAGCFVLDGTIHRTDYVRIYRGGRLIYGQDKQIGVDSLKRFKDDAREVREGFECGIRISQYQDVKPNDVLEFYEIKEIQRKLA
ncbi:MAG: Translation initiation factor IF-2 [Planctomycetes bacterium]|nr:Translation initiation factor IF-2 [Planctomycetota bacterium]